MNSATKPLAVLDLRFTDFWSFGLSGLGSKGLRGLEFRVYGLRACLRGLGVQM